MRVVSNRETRTRGRSRNGLPVGGLLGELLYARQAGILPSLRPELDPCARRPASSWTRRLSGSFSRKPASSRAGWSPCHANRFRSGRTPRREEAISDHPCLKPQHFMRIIVRALLPLGEGTVLDPFMGSGSTIAAAEAVGYRSVGIEIDKDYFRLAEAAIPKLAALYPTFEGACLEFDSSDYPQEAVEEGQLTMALAESPARYRVRKS